ncbi:MAG: SpoIIE family protein phosphatase [Actinobacteria bacterium]|nr:SpoIIE family protein phosphatase [Actinomycetota bacterium]
MAGHWDPSADSPDGVWRARMRSLQRATRALSSALTPDDVLAAIVQEAVAALDAQQGVVVLADDTDTTLLMRHVVGLDDGVEGRWRRIPMSMDVPLADVVRSGESVYVPTRDEMLERFPAVADEVGRGDRHAWAITPIGATDASPAGALMVAWTRSHTADRGERELLEAFADLCAPALGRAGVYERTAEVATALQTSLLPQAMPEVEGIDLHARYVPTGRGDVGGDWYDVLPLGDDRLALIVGDVVGHGVWAAAQMGQVRHALRTLAFVESDPIRILELFDGKVAQYGEAVMATAMVGFVDMGGGRFHYAEAGHPPVLIRRSDGHVDVLPASQRPPLGAHHGPVPGSASASADFRRGDTMLVYTDGLVERHGESIDDGLERLVGAFAIAPADPAAAADHLIAAMVGEILLDDLAVLLLRRT